MSHFLQQRLSQFTFLLVGLLCFSTQVGATSIQQMDVDELIDNSELVFEGRVLSADARWNKSHTLIKTFITFEILDVLSGDYFESQLELSFLGGKIGQDEIKAQGLRQPAVGEKGIYFIESLTKSLVNPLVGWSQGQFLLESNDSGRDVVMTDTHHPVVGLSEDSASIRNKRINTKGELSEGVAQGVLVRKEKGARNSAMMAAEFKKKLKSRMLSAMQK